MDSETIKNHFRNMPERNIIPVLAFFSLGIILTDQCPLFISFIILFLAGLSAFLSKKTKIIILALVLIFGGTDYLAYRLMPKDSVARLNTEKIEWAEGTIVSDTEKHSSSYIFYVKTNKAKYKNKIIKCSGKIAVYLKCEKNISRETQ